MTVTKCNDSLCQIYHRLNTKTESDNIISDHIKGGTLNFEIYIFN
jgi:hypothetical protein